jgi:serine phosphatase RsbU (regulator of sigma subunit)
MKKQLLFLLLIVSVFCFAGNKTDSLAAYIQTAKDTNKINAILDLSFEYENSEPLKALSYLNEALQLSKTLEFDRGIVLSLIPMGTIYNQQNEFYSADSCLNEALKTAQKINAVTLQGNIYNNLGMNYFSKFDYDKSLQNYFKAADIFAETKDSIKLASTFNNIANVYFIQKELDKALQYHLKSLDLSRKMGSKSRIASSLNNLGLIYRDKGDYKKALECYNEALSIAQQINHKVGQSLLLNNMGKIYRIMKNYSEAEKSFQQSVVLKKELNDVGGLAHCYNNMGDLYLDMKQYDKSITYNLMAVEEAKKKNNLGILQNAYLSLSEVYGTKKNFEQAYNYHILYINYKDSIFNAEKSQQLNELSTKYETQLKDKEIVKKDAEIKVKETETKQKETQRNAFVVGFILVAVLTVLIFKNLKDKQRANKKLAEAYTTIEIKNNIVEQKNKDITDSINYARRIQRALLASDKILDKNFPEHFVFYKPKDIVSGDFYWATALNDTFYFATCDCTGHGVPGAFMSLLNISKLNEAINEKLIGSPHSVFNHVRSEISKALNPDGVEVSTYDGMDAVLCAYDFKNMQLNFACANNPLWLVRNGQLKEYKADKMPVGKSETEESFTLQTIELQKGDCIYTFTDGYADQFGGEKGKKFKYKQLQEKIIATAHLPLKDQKEQLVQILVQWQGKMEQVDDILVVGVRV